MTAVPSAADDVDATTVGLDSARATRLISSEAAATAGTWLFAFLLVFLLSLDGAGYWPTSRGPLAALCHDHPPTRPRPRRRA